MYKAKQSGMMVQRWRTGCFEMRRERILRSGCLSCSYMELCPTEPDNGWPSREKILGRRTDVMVCIMRLSWAMGMFNGYRWNTYGVDGRIRPGGKSEIEDLGRHF